MTRWGWHFYLSILLILAIVVISTGNYLRWWDMIFRVGPLYILHWLGIIGAGYIAVITPTYSILRRRNQKQSKALLSLHVFGNLTAFLLISLHFTQQLSRPAQFAPQLSTGLILYITLAIMLLTGFIYRYQLMNRYMKGERFIHAGLSLSFYIVVAVHVLHSLDLI
jgi:uncharacterized membrane protein